MTEKIVYSFDYETFFTKEYSLRNMPVRAYVYDERFDAYMVSVAGSNGFLWVGHPKDFDWKMFDGQIVIAHNMSFDWMVAQRLIKDGTIPNFTPAELHDTADLAAYLQHPRALKDHAKYVWGLHDIAEAGKKARERMATMKPEDLMTDPEILEYATNDAKLCLRLWQEFSDQWPEEERELSRLNREACFYGIAVDLEYAQAAKERLAHKLFDAERAIPWDWSGKKTPLSRNQIIAHAESTIVEERPLTDDVMLKTLLEMQSRGERGEETLVRYWKSNGGAGREFSRIELFERDMALWVRFFMWYPASFAQGDPDCERWEEEFGDVYPWIGALRNWRRINMLLGKVTLLINNTFDGIFYPQIKYAGARTGRFAGDGKMNLQNLPREEMFCNRGPDGKAIKGTGCDLRRCFIARPGHVLAQIDYAQVEARALVAIVGDEPMLEQLRRGVSIYEAHARATMGWTGGELKKENPELYRLAKARCLGLGYGCSGKKFVLVAKILAGLDISEKEAFAVVEDFRAKNPGIVALWSKLDQKIRTHAARKADVCEFVLHSGRSLYYWKPTMRVPKDQDRPQLMSMTERGNPNTFRKCFGQLCCENVTQAICRDVLRDAWINLAKHGYRVLWSVHDELIVELPEGADVKEAERIMLDAPEWAKFIPLAVESVVSKHYTK